MKELTPGYYRDNFLKLAVFVEETYGDILNKRETSFLDRFRKLSLGAQRLYVRLISRKGPLFRLSRLTYHEIDHIPQAAAELEGQGFLEGDGPAPLEERLACYTKPELVKIFSPLGLTNSLSRPEAVKVLLDQPEVTAALLSRADTLLRPLEEEAIQTFRLLFFGNLYQDLSEFVITDLDLVTYENYPLDRENRLFPDRQALDNALAYHRAGELFREKREEGVLTGEELISLAEGLPEPGEDYFLIRRRDRLINEMAREMERRDLADRALAFYGRSEHAPARERRIRLLFRREEYGPCLSLLEAILEDPENEEEREFALFFRGKVTKRLTGKSLPRKKPAVPDMKIRCNRERRMGEANRVELSALDYFLERGYRGFYTENRLWNALFGLAFWDIVFAPRPGVFFNPYQRGPADLGHPEFRKARETLFRKRFRELANDMKWREGLLDRFDKSLGVANPFVDWKNVERTQVEAALERIPRNHLLPLWDRLSRDVRGNSSGFPDLLLFPPADSGLSYLPAEVKGPGDKLQKNQLRWIEAFREIGIPFRLILLEWDDSQRDSSPR